METRHITNLLLGLAFALLGVLCRPFLLTTHLLDTDDLVVWALLLHLLEKLHRLRKQGLSKLVKNEINDLRWCQAEPLYTWVVDGVRITEHHQNRNTHMMSEKCQSHDYERIRFSMEREIEKIKKLGDQHTDKGCKRSKWEDIRLWGNDKPGGSPLGK